MGGKKRRKPAASETPWDGVDAAKLTPAQLLVRDSHRSIYDFRHEAFGERDKEGNWIDDIPDGNDHSIDAVRYAMMDDVLRG